MIKRGRKVRGRMIIIMLSVIIIVIIRIIIVIKITTEMYDNKEKINTSKSGRTIGREKSTDKHRDKNRLARGERG